MKRYILIVLIPLFSISLFAQSDSYSEAMKNAITMMDTSTSTELLQYAANSFERIGDAVEDEWLPYYYCAYCYVQLNYLVKTDKKRDVFVDKAVEFNNKADNVSQDNSEIYVMKGFILQARMNIDPMTRGIKYNPECIAMFKKAIELNPENPRSYLWYGVNLYNTPSFFGGGKDNAYPLLQKAAAKFDTFVPKSKIHPDWGKAYANKMLSKYE